MRLVLAVVLLMASLPLRAETLRIGLAGRVTSLDPHFFVGPANTTAAMHLFDRLLHRAPDGSLQPWLATTWALVDDSTLELRLRPDARWHDGAPVTADDVAFTIERVRALPNSPGGYAGIVRPIRRVEVTDPLTVRLHTDGPAPNLPGDLALLAIVSRHVGAGAGAEAYNDGRATIGSGPYRLARHLNGEVIELTRNEAWWGSKPEWDRVDLRMAPNAAARTAALLAGDLDVIEFPNPSDMPRLRADPRVAVHAVEGVQAVFLGMDFSRTGEEPFVTDNAGRPLPANPLRDPRVRHALSLAINRQALAERTLEGMATPTGQWLPPGVFSYAASVTPPRQDLAAARRLLTEAGFPDGFKMTLFGPSDRLPADVATMQAVAQMFTRAGVTTAVEALPFANFVTRAMRQEFPIRLTSWNSPTLEASYLMVNMLLTYDPARGHGSLNTGRYSDQALDALTEQALHTIDPQERERLLIKAVEAVAADMPIIPLYLNLNTWAVRSAIRFEPRLDQRTLAFDMRRATP